MKRVTLVATLLCALTFSACARDKQPVAFENLPEQVQKEVLKNFTKDQIQFVIADKEFMHYEYKFVLTNGLELEYDDEAVLLQAESKTGIPEALIDAEILNYIKTTFPNAVITEYKLDDGHKEVELNNEMELVFNKNNQFLRID